MKIALAQIRTVKGNISENIKTHLKFINLAAKKGADLIIFPELSITGYEPELAEKLAIRPTDTNLTQIQKTSNSKGIIICLGAPTIHKNGICISLLIIKPNQPIQVYSKEYLHSDECPYFIKGNEETNFIKGTSISLAICYEIFEPAHANKAQNERATIYLASVAKSEKGIKKAYKRLSQVAKENRMLVLMCNNIGYCDNFDAKGQTAAWNIEGQLIGQLNDSEEGLLVIDTVKNPWLEA